MSKKIFSIFIIILVLLGLCGTVFAKDTYTATSTINGVTVNWSYELNDSNQIENLKCINPTDLIGNVIIPSTLDGKTVVTLGDSAFKSATKITEITIPNSVKEIGLGAFSGCTSLSNINLGNVERICDQSFKNCTSLTSIKLPKTLNKGASGAPFSGCENLKNIELEEGMTVVPDYVCASTPITEITIPNSVKKIGLWTFKNCTFLKKITILDNVTEMGGYNSSNTDLVFENHNDSLTVYCYKDSMAANYAIKYNIKYVYLTKPAIDNNEENKEDKKQNITEPAIDAKQENPTIATGKLPQAGSSPVIIISIIAVMVILIINYKRYNSYKDIK